MLPTTFRLCLPRVGLGPPVTGYLFLDAMTVKHFANMVQPPLIPRHMHPRSMWVSAEPNSTHQLHAMSSSFTAVFLPGTNYLTVHTLMTRYRYRNRGQHRSKQQLGNCTTVRHQIVAAVLIGPPFGWFGCAAGLAINRSRVPLPASALPGIDSGHVVHVHGPPRR